MLHDRLYSSQLATRVNDRVTWPRGQCCRTADHNRPVTYCSQLLERVSDVADVAVPSVRLYSSQLLERVTWPMLFAVLPVRLYSSQLLERVTE